jgi:HSP20 family protein
MLAGNKWFCVRTALAPGFRCCAIIEGAMLQFPDLGDLADEVRRVFDELERGPEPCRPGATVFTPALDVVERPEAIDIYVDLPGVVSTDVRVIFKRGTLGVAGNKRPPEPASGRTRFLLVERGCGRFARAVRITGPVDVQRARAAFRDGELHVSLPRLEERRGREFVIPVEAERAS